MRSAALLEARARGAEAFPLLAVDWKARGLDLGRGVYSPAMRRTALGQVTAVTRAGGWDPITYGSGIGQSSLDIVTTKVDVSDPNHELLDMLETYDPRGSAARIDWAAANLVADDYEPLFRGIVSDWARAEPFTTLILKTDDAVLRTPIPSGVFDRTLWGSAEDVTIFQSALPLVLGLHDSFHLTTRGAVPLVNIRYDKDLGYWWALSSDRMVQVDRLYFDGIQQGPVGVGWSVLSGVFGSTQFTIVVIPEGYQPAKDVIVSVDCKGPDELGKASGSTLTGVPDQLRALLQEFAFRKPPLGAWRGAQAAIDASSWEAASAFFALHRMESARRLGVDQNPESAAELIQSFLDANPFVRIQWTELGTLQMVVIDPDDVDPAAEGLALDLHHKGGDVPFVPGDLREVYTQFRMAYCFMAADDKFLSSYEAHDVAALPDKVVLSIDNVWTQARPDQDISELNPQPPADPVHP